MNWQLDLFLFGLLACGVGAVFAATRFCVTESEAAVWNRNPTTEEIGAANVAAVKRKSACLASLAIQ